MGGESLSAISSEAYFKGEGKGLDLSSHLLSLGMTLTKCFSSTRLETRTKESNMCASVRDFNPKREINVKEFFGVLR